MRGALDVRPFRIDVAGLAGAARAGAGTVFLRDDDRVWTYLPLWLVQDGQVDELAPGSHLSGTAITASCVHAVATGLDRPAGVVRSASPHGSSGLVRSYLYDVTGVATGVRDMEAAAQGDGAERVGSEFLLSVGSMELIARTWDFFFEPTEGSPVTVVCSLEVMADYELDAFQLPDVRGDWLVTAVQIERRALVQREVVDASARTHVQGTPGDVIELVDVPRMRKWADDPVEAKHSTVAAYVVDLHPR
jgi:hypothetical protein